jgi:outer membrane protein OmpA-like peptidoglycan-associated protein
MRIFYLRIFYFLLVLSTLSCAYTKKVNNGQVAYDSKKYSIAVDLLGEEFNEAKNKEVKARKAYQIAKSYTFLNQNKNALEWFSKAAELEYGPAAIRQQALAFKRDQQYVAAIRAFENLERLTGKDSQITREINICKQALNWLEPNEKVEVALFPFEANSEYMEYSPFFYGEELIVFSSDRVQKEKDQIYEWTGNGFSDLYVLNRNTNDVLIFDTPVNSEFNEATAVFNKDNTEIFFTRCFSEDAAVEDQYCRIMHSSLEDSRWSEPVQLVFQESNRNYGHPALIEEDSVLVFTLKENDGSETYDLYYSVLDEEGWSEAIPMPESINTDGNEKFPTSDGDTLYFSSDYLPGLGGLDIFKTYLRADNSWSSPNNLKAPFNSGSDDFGLIVDRVSSSASDIVSKGYFSSTRSEASNDDIFGYEVRRKIEEIETEEPVEEITEDFKVYIAGRVVLNLYEQKNNPASKLIGKDPLQGAEVTLNSSVEQYNFVSDDKGRFLQEVSKDQDFRIEAFKEDYLSSRKVVSTRNLKVEKSKKSITINVELALSQIEYGKEIVLDNIYYDLDKYAIREDAQPSLDRLSTLLLNNPSISIELASHTDCQGNNAYNQNLSQKRAQSAVNYIVTKGISKSRLIARGYGENRLQETCACEDCTDDQHQRNRRTSFTVLKGE